MFFCLAVSQATELMQPVALTDPAYKHLRLLSQWGLLPEGRDKLLDVTNQRTLTRYDIAFLLVEPLERCVALAEVQENTRVLPEQRRRAEMAYLTASALSAEDFDRLLTTLGQLVRAFSGEINELSPGLSPRALGAMRKLLLPAFRPWTATSGSIPLITPVVHLSINPNATTDSLDDTLAFMSPPPGGRTALFVRRSLDGPSAESTLVGSRPASSLETAIDIAFGRFRLYGSLATLPGQDTAQVILKPDGSGKAMFGVQVDVARVRDLGISGIFEFHITRQGDPENLNINTGAVGGIGLSW